MSDFPFPEDYTPDDVDLETEIALPNDIGQERSVARRLALQILYEVESIGGQGLENTQDVVF